MTDRLRALLLSLVAERTRAGLADRANAAASDADLAIARARGCEG